MKKNIQKVQSILAQLKEMNDFLGGGGLKADYTQQNVELSQVLTLFRQEIFSIRQAQKQRDFKEEKLGKAAPELIQLNFAIRQGIEKCKKMLITAEKRAVRNKKFKDLTPEERTDLKKKLDNCASLLQDVREVEEGGTYRPPQIVTLQALKQQLLENRQGDIDPDQQSINVDEIQAFDEFNRNDRVMDQKLDNIIQGNERVKNTMKAVGEAIDESSNKIRNVTKAVDSTNERINKTQDRLVELLKTYRRPNMLCLDITLIVLLLGLIAVIVNMVRSKTM